MKKVSDFYSGNLKSWLKILSKNSHYNVGIYDGINDPSENLIRSLFKYLTTKSHILDCGCGWGGTSIMLKNELKSKVTSITNSKFQFDYLKNILDRVILAELEDFVPDKYYDSAIFIQSICHVDDVNSVIKNLNGKVKKIIINEFFSYRNYFKDNEWNMNFRTLKEYKQLLENNGYIVIEVKDITCNRSKLEFARTYLDKINMLNKNEIVGQISILKSLCHEWLRSPFSRDYGLATIFAISKL